jgi:hypothetical protein
MAKIKLIIEATYEIDPDLTEGVTLQDIADEYAAVFSGGGATKTWREYGYEVDDIEAKAELLGDE